MPLCHQPGFKWDGQPVGKETKLDENDVYVTGSNPDVAILIVHNIFGWTLPNLRLLADQYAEEIGATVYVPDFFDGEVLSSNLGADFDMNAFMARHSKDIRYPEILSCAIALKRNCGYKKLGAMGFCYGGWAVFRLGAEGNNLVDCISTAHPAFLTKEEIDSVGVPVQILAPEHDEFFTPELKAHVNKVIPTLGVEYDYQYFPGMGHGFTTRGDQSDMRHMEAVDRAKNAVVGWFAQMLRSH